MKMRTLTILCAALMLPLTTGCLFHKDHGPEHPDKGFKGYKMGAYTVRGQRFVPMGIQPALHYKAEGLATYYEAGGSRGALGETLHRGELYAAHRTLPMPCYVRVTNLSNGRTVDVRVADRGPFGKGRIIDLSTAAAAKLGMISKGVQKVRVEVLSVGDGPYRRKP